MLRRPVLALPIAALVAPSARAQAFPSRPVRWIVPFAPGGGTDLVARLLAAELQPRLGQPVVVENRPGANTIIGTEALAKSAPDGHTVSTADNGTLVFNTALFPRLPYDPKRDLKPVGPLARFHLALAVHPSVPAASFGEFVAFAKSKGSVDFGSPGIGSPHHLAMERLARAAGFQGSHVPYRGMAPALTDLAGGTIPAMIVDLAAGSPFLKAGTVRGIALASDARWPSLPELPTFEEAGLPGFLAHAWQGMMAPAGTPDAVVARLNADLVAALRSGPVQARMAEIGLEPLAGPPEALAGLIEVETAVWVPLIRELGIRLEL